MQYVMAGAWALLFFGCGSVIACSLIGRTRSLTTLFTSAPLLHYACVGLAFFVLSFLPLLGHINARAHFSLGTRAMVCTTIALIAALPLPLLRNARRRSQRFDTAQAFLVLSFLLSFVVYIQYFSCHVYGDIHQALGGGEPRRARLVLTQEAQKPLAAAGMHVTKGRHPSVSVTLIAAMDKAYVVHTGTPGHTVRIRREMVEAVVYEAEASLAVYLEKLPPPFRWLPSLTVFVRNVFLKIRGH
jgi:hypothetical protein